nr:unnamed protein product [Naegleria fowleri]
MSRQSHKEHLSSLISSSTSSRYSSSPNQSNNFLSNALLTSGDQTPPTNPESPLTMNLPINNEEYNAMMNEGAYSTSPTLTSNTLQFIIPSIYGKQEENEEENIFVSIIKKSSQQNAIESICRLLETPQDLEKLADLKANTQKQVEKLETQVSTLSSTQIEEADQAIQLIKQIRGDVREQLDERVENSIFGLMRDLGENNMQLIEHYDVVSEILLAHNNVRKTIEKLETLTILQDQIRRIKKKLSYENDKYVLSAHEDIIALEEIKDDALSEVKAKITRSDYNDIFEKFFNMIDDIRNRFEELVWLRLSDIEYTAENEPEAIVRIARIIEKEENRDQRKQLEYEDKLEEAKRKKKQGTSNKRLTDSNDSQEKLILKPKLRNMKEEFYKRMRQHVADKYNEAVHEAKGADDKIQGLNMLLSDKLNVGVTRYVVTCFPPSWNILPFFAQAYEEELIKFIQGLTQPKSPYYNSLSMGDKLKIVRWLEDYPSLVDEAIEKPYDFSTDRNRIIGDYIGTRSTFMIEYTGNTVAQDFKNFEEVPLNENARGFPYTAACVEVFTFINQQLDELLETGIDDIIPTSISGLNAALRYFIDASYQRFEEHITEIPLVVLCALMNNNTTSVDYLTVIEQRTEHLVEEDYNTLREQFRRNGIKMAETVAEQVVMKDALTLMKDLFTDYWITVPDEKVEKEELIEYLKECPVYKVVELIFEPYMRDFEELLEIDFRDVLVEKLAELFVGGYLEKLLNSKIKFKEPFHAANQMKEDIRLIKRLFTAEVSIKVEGKEFNEPRMDSDDFNEYYEAMKSVFMHLKAKTPEDVMKNIKNMLDTYDDISIDLLYNLLVLRDDFSKKERQEMEQKLETMYSEYEDKTNPNAKLSIFGKIDKTPPNKRRKTKKSKNIVYSTSTSSGMQNLSDNASKNAQYDSRGSSSGGGGASRNNPKYEVPEGAVNLSELLGDEKLDFSFEDDEDEDYQSD